MRIQLRTPEGLLKPHGAIALAGCFHIVVALTIFGVGRLGFVPTQFDRDGIGQFARDSQDFRDQALSLAGMLGSGQIESWVKDGSAFHVKIYSLNLVLMRPLLGSSILAVEPVNLLYYLAMLGLTFSLARVVAGQRAGWIAAVIVAMWPSLLLHTTQLVRDPLLIIALLLFFIVLAELLMRVYDWRATWRTALLGTLACVVIRLCRPDMWLVIFAIVLLVSALLLVRLLRERRFLVWNMAFIVLLGVLIITLHRIAFHKAPQPSAILVAALPGDKDSSVWGRIENNRARFIFENLKSGSTIDTNVVLHNRSDVIKYIPRALEIGYFAPFPGIWFTRGYNVGLIGRLLSGAEMLLTYVIEALACVFVWRERRRPETWMLLLTTMIGVVALGLVVVNIGTLYRMRYPFWILLVVMAAATLVRLIAPKRLPGVKEDGETGKLEMGHGQSSTDRVFSPRSDLLLTQTGQC